MSYNGKSTARASAEAREMLMEEDRDEANRQCNLATEARDRAYDERQKYRHENDALKDEVVNLKLNRARLRRTHKAAIIALKTIRVRIAHHSEYIITYFGAIAETLGSVIMRLGQDRWDEIFGVVCGNPPAFASGVGGTGPCGASAGGAGSSGAGSVVQVPVVLVPEEAAQVQVLTVRVQVASRYEAYLIWL